MSIFSRSLRTKTSTVRSRCEARRPQTRCRSSSRVSTRPCSSASAYSSRNSVGVSSALAPSTYACTLRGSSRSSSITISSPRRGILRARAAAGGGADPRGELLHRERLHEVVVGADLERVHTVVLGAARRDDDDRRADSLATRLLDHLPAVEPGEHQVEHADVGPLEAQSRQPVSPFATPTASKPAACR